MSTGPPAAIKAAIRWWHRVNVGDRVKVVASQPDWIVSFKKHDKMILSTLPPEPPGVRTLYYSSDLHREVVSLAVLNGELPPPPVKPRKQPKTIQGSLYLPGQYRVNLVKRTVRRTILPPVRTAVHEKSNWTCQGCGWSPGVGKVRGTRNGLDTILTVDHIQPRARGGADHIDNYETLCEPCNTYKSDTWPWHWVEHERKYW